MEPRITIDYSEYKALKDSFGLIEELRESSKTTKREEDPLSASLIYTTEVKSSALIKAIMGDTPGVKGVQHQIKIIPDTHISPSRRLSR